MSDPNRNNIITFEGKQYQAKPVVNGSCNGCAFEDYDTGCTVVHNDSIACTPGDRGKQGLSEEHVIYLSAEPAEPAEPAESPHIIMVGNPVDGYEFIGPFATAEEAIEYPQLHGMDDVWHEVQLTPPKEVGQ